MQFFFEIFKSATLKIVWNLQKSGLEKNFRMDVFASVRTYVRMLNSKNSNFYIKRFGVRYLKILRPAATGSHKLLGRSNWTWCESKAEETVSSV